MSIVSWFTNIFCPPTPPRPQRDLPRDVLGHTFSFLMGKEFASSFRVCKLWKSAIQSRLLDPKPEGAFGREEWITCNLGDPGRAPFLPPSIFEILQRTSRFWPEVRVGANHAIMFVSPKIEKNKVNFMGTVGDFNILVDKSSQGIGGQDFSIEFCIALAQNPALGNIKKPYWFLITHDLIPGSKGKTYKEQEKLLKSEGYSVPCAYEVMVLVYTEYLRTERKLLKSELTHCDGFLDGNGLIMGKFDKETGLVIEGEEDKDKPGMLGVIRFE